MFRKVQIAVLAVLLVVPLRFATAQAPTVRPLAEIGPWPVVSQLIEFQGRVWFANSVKGVNHNSADLYSLSLADRDVRFERPLFSQDAGDAVVLEGRLYWPLEDSRNSVGWAEVTLTDGKAWRRRAIPGARAFHNHAMVAWRGGLVAATSAWRAGLQGSSDGGMSWRRLYDHPTPERRVSRVVRLAAAETFFLGHLIDVGQHRLLRSNGEETALLNDWPEDLPVTALAGKANAVYIAANAADGIVLWRSDGSTLRQLEVSLPDGRVQDLQAAAGRLWMLTTAAGGGGSVWSSADGLGWREDLRLDGGTPWDLHVGTAGLYVGGTAESGLGALWVQGESLADDPGDDLSALSIASAPAGDLDWAAEATSLDNLLAAPASYAARSTLRDEIYRLAMAGPPEGFFAARLAVGEGPAGDIPLIGGQVRVRNRGFADWLLLWGMGLNGQSGVPAGLLLKPWASAANPAEKYFEPAPSALWAVVMAGQADRATIATLIERLGFADDPDWLRNQVAGTLATLTGQPKHPNQDRWLDWWALAEPGWPD
ncbi:hypothetical protein HBA54_00485 [Pelagibius litoralis]|uniref:Uncharacterized protein n=1 Tax=Pelagibius litoralis TaxID=374515 RepID=A0A967C9N8_9PROT|nr:hypothetical protein [Pelagibius litoralis]NIA67063.1 hypothetical protein [Pelagibius litoralis]